MRNRNAPFLGTRRLALADLGSEIAESQARKMENPLPGHYFLGFGKQMKSGWFEKERPAVSRTLTVFRDVEGMGLKEDFEFITNIAVNIEYPYRICETELPVDMAKEVAWIVRFFDLIPPTEDSLPRHFLEQSLTSHEFWQGQTYCSSSIDLSNGWDPNWKSRWMSLPLPSHLRINKEPHEKQGISRSSSQRPPFTSAQNRRTEVAKLAARSVHSSLWRSL